MAGKSKRGQRIEPTLKSSRAGDLNVRPTARDRAAVGLPAGKQSKKQSGPSEKKPSRTGTKPSKGRSGSDRRKTTKRRRRAGGSGGWISTLLKRTVYWGAVLGIWAGIAVIGVIGYYAAHLPPTSEWAVPARPPNVKIVSVTGELIANRGDTGGEAVRLEQLPPYLPNAVIAIEDRRFRSHIGVDPIGLARAAFVNLMEGRVAQGGSTLTQQLAKNLFLQPDRTMKRKVQELVLAFWLEAEFSKDEILEMYLNRVYLGAGAYGVDAAARRYFGKSARLLTVAESATLAGLLKAPSRFSPTRNPDLAEQRAQVVLMAMHEEGYITSNEAKMAIANPAAVVTRYTTASKNYAADYVMDVLPHFIGALDSDIIVDTTIDLKTQEDAEKALRDALAANGAEYRVTQGAIVTLDTAGAIRAMVGGANYAKSQFNRAAYAKRQPGSAFKPFVYLAALESGLTASTIRQDQPVSFGGWAPRNYTKEHYGPVSLTRALSMSLNTVAAQLAHEVGVKVVVNTSKKMGITSDLSNNLSISLGTSEVTPLEIASAYVPFSNGGYGVLPHVIRQIRTVDGEVLYARSGEGRGRVISRQTVGEMNMMMRETLLTGTGRAAQLESGRPAGGKTGTTQNFRDAWFIGYTGNLTTAVWIGNDDNSPTKKATGGNLPAEIWRETMDRAHQGFPVAELPGIPAAPVMVARPADSGPSRTNGEDGTLVMPEATAGRGPLDLFRTLFGG
ncbi:penicillin-binding protein [Roseibium aquae]|uniref:Penicillin-binding protein n=1 Tax=Roseibium aquae TaxID=1323746 RepID=A0A916WXQ8_9HYPH|nr:PBP1A family penicillin-binding protein [Roseibium aquae]GGB40623.1 penicillin-binding protein [Roseibium aquae]